ncbi:MAG: nickel-dependent lactate racemase, partial [Actinomycetota bacterium]|nr:nickel-dependent lactate racemase [Actinomycetota bacterium]
MSRPGFVLEVDRSTPPILFHRGEGFSLEKLPAGSRVVYPAEPLKPLADPEGAIRHALLNPVGDSQPLPSLLRPGMKLTIAMDNQAVPLPSMQRPDNRQRVVEIVLDMAAAAGVDDVQLVIAHGL